MSSTEVAAPTNGAVPALADTPATTIGFEDVGTSTLYIAQRTSTAVDNRLANYGDLFVAQGADDSEVEVLWQTGSTDQGVLFIPLHMYKTHTFSDGNNLRSWAWGNGEPPQEALDMVEADEGRHPLFRTYNYVVLLPDYDTEVPVYLRLNSKSQRPAANKVNLTVSRSGKPWHASAFRITTAKKESGANKWAVPVVVEAKATKAQFEQAERLLQLITPGLQARQAAESRALAAPSI